MSSAWIVQVGPKSNDKCPGKKEMMETEIGEIPGAARVRRTKEGFFLRPQKHHGPMSTLISDFWPLELQVNKFLLSLAIQFVVTVMVITGK
jgi:hypothetical protein